MGTFRRPTLLWLHWDDWPQVCDDMEGPIASAWAPEGPMRVRSGLLTCTQNNELGLNLTDHQLFLIYEETTARLIGCVSLALHFERDEGASGPPQPNCTDWNWERAESRKKSVKYHSPFFQGLSSSDVSALMSHRNWVPSRHFPPWRPLTRASAQAPAPAKLNRKIYFFKKEESTEINDNNQD